MALWFVASVNPYNTTIWAIENIILFLGFVFIIETHKNSLFSNFSYLLIFIFAVLQTTGSHYTYAQVPIGFELQTQLELTRNHYDRMVHFCFGLLLALPVKEYFEPKIFIAKKFLFILFFTLIFLGLGGLYETLEWVYVLLANSENSKDFLGEQGDRWDAQKDIALAGLGAFIALVLIAIFDKKQQQSGYSTFKE